MKGKTIVTVTLLFFVGASVAYLVFDEVRSRSAGDTQGRASDDPTTSTVANAPAPPEGMTDGVVAYYFHTNVRCTTCRRMEAYSKEAVLTSFGRELEEGRLAFLTANTDKPENKHFAKAYDLVAASVVLAEFRDGKQVRWKNLDDIWNLTDEKAAFLAYVKHELEQFLGDSR